MSDRRLWRKCVIGWSLIPSCLILMQASRGDVGRRLAQRQDDLHSDSEPRASDRDELRGSAGEGLTQTGSPLPGVQT